MREPSAKRDQREIVVPGDMRAARPSAASPRSGAAGARRPPGRRTQAPPGELRATLSAVLSWTGRICTTRPGEVAGSVLVLGAALYVSLNALGFQAGRHPAPILPRLPVEAAKALPPVRQIAAPSRPAEPAPAKVADAAAKETPVKESPRARDPIGDVLRGVGDTTASVTPRAAKDAPDKTRPDPSVIRAQRALAKLGYGPLKDDGLMGPGTRAAIERFERDRKLPVKGEPAGRTLRELAGRAGLPQG